MLPLPPLQLPLPKPYLHLHLLKPPKTPFSSYHSNYYLSTPNRDHPLGRGQDFPSTSPLDKGKGVVNVPSDDEEDTAEGPVFKRRMTTIVATSHSTSNKHAESLREHPPSASTPPNYMAMGEGAETAPEPTPAPAPKLPRVVQHLLKGFQQVPPEGPTDEAVEESVAYSLGEFFSRASS